MRLSTGINLLNVLIVLALIAALTAPSLVVINAFGVLSSIRVGEPSVSSSGSVVEFSVPIGISNSGPFGVSDVRIYGEVRDAGGDLITSISSPPFSVAPGEIGTQRHLQIRINLSDIPQGRLQTLFSQAGNLTLLASLGLSIDPLISISAQASGTIPWEPPVKDFELGEPAVLGYNSTHIFASMPVRFENPSEIAVEGAVEVLFVDLETGSEMGSGYLDVNAPPGSIFEGELHSSFRLPENATALLLEARTYRCNATFGFRLFGIRVYTISSPLELQWSPPVDSPYLGSPSITPYNSTHSRFSLPFGFVNSNSLVTLDGSLSLGLAVGDVLVSESDPVGVHVPPGSGCSCNLTMLVPDWALSVPGALILSLDTPFGSASMEVPING